MTVGFSGEVAEYYARYRRGYPARVLDTLRSAFGLGAEDVVLDLGCGTGQLAIPLADRVRSVVGMDPEPDMLRLAREAAEEREVHNVVWLLGADTNVPAVRSLLGPSSLGAVVIGQAVHWMRHEELFSSLGRLLRPGGGVAVVANGTPLWLQNTDWSRALRACLENHFGQRLVATCGTSDEDRRGYVGALRDAGFTDVWETLTEYEDSLSFDQLVGAVRSAVPADALPDRDARNALVDAIRAALPSAPYFTEMVRVTSVMATVSAGSAVSASARPAVGG